MYRIIITGTSGFIGRHLVKRLLSYKEHNLVLLSNTTHVNSFIFTYSAAVYGNVRELPIKEDNMLKPLSAYGTSKMLAEQHIASYQTSKKIHNAISLRIFSAYGTGVSSEADVITRFATRLSKGLSPVIYGDGSQTRDFISVDDVVEGIFLSISAMEKTENSKHSLPLVFNIGTGTPISINQLAQKMIGLFGLELEPIYKGGEENTGVIKHSCADITRAKELLHFVAKTRIDTGLREIIARMNHNVPKSEHSSV